MRDFEVRSALLGALEQTFAADPATRIIGELGLRGGIVRVDVAVLNGSIHGYEIKSERDTLDRLPMQIEIYSQVLDLATIVMTGKHEERCFDLIPDWWGLMSARLVDGRVELEALRSPRQNPRIEESAFLEFLWRDEAIEILASAGATTGAKSASKDRLRRRLSEVIPFDQLHDMILSKMKARAFWRLPSPQK